MVGPRVQHPAIASDREAASQCRAAGEGAADLRGAISTSVRDELARRQSDARPRSTAFPGTQSAATGAAISHRRTSPATAAARPRPAVGSAGIQPGHDQFERRRRESPAGADIAGHRQRLPVGRVIVPDFRVTPTAAGSRLSGTDVRRLGARQPASCPHMVPGRGLAVCETAASAALHNRLATSARDHREPGHHSGRRSSRGHRSRSPMVADASRTSPDLDPLVLVQPQRIGLGHPEGLRRTRAGCGRSGCSGTRPERADRWPSAAAASRS